MLHGLSVYAYLPQIFQDSIPEVLVQECVGDLSTILMEGWF